MPRKGGVPENLRPPFKKGDVGNPKGRPRKPIELKEELNAALSKLDGGRTNLQIIIEKAVSMAKKGDMSAMREVFDRTFGKPKQAIDHTTLGQAFTPVINVMTQEAADEITRIKIE